MSKLNFLEDEHLITAIRNGGRNREMATDQMMRDHIGFVYTIKSKLHLDEDVALDCFVDALADVVEQVGNGKFEGKSKLSTYLYQITYFRGVDHLRKNRLDITHLEQLPEQKYLAKDLNEKIDNESEFLHIKRELKSIGEPCEGILMDWGFWGYNMDEIAQRNGLKSASIAKSRKYQCLQRLRGLLQKVE